MAVEAKTAQDIDATFTATMTTNSEVGGWTVVVMPGSGEYFGTRRPVKIAGTIDGHPFSATFLPSGDGTHMLPIKAAVRKLIGKEAGAEITVHLQQRFS